MIYEFPEVSQPLRQGDIFFGVPRVDLELEKIILAEEDGPSQVSWGEIATRKEPLNIIVGVRPVTAIIASQDCDASRAPNITLCEIRDFREIELKCKDTTSPKKWRNIITQHARINQKWFYLPPDTRIGFESKMAVDFMVTLRVRRTELELLRHLRKGRLNNIADEHFRERIGEFFRRYPYDEWYPLDQAEMISYLDDYPDAEPFGWQQVNSDDTAPKK